MNRTIVYHLCEPGENGPEIIEELINKFQADKGYFDDPVRAKDKKKIRSRMIKAYLRPGDTLKVKAVCNLVLTRDELLEVTRALEAKGVNLVIDDYPETGNIAKAVHFMTYFQKSVRRRASGFARKSSRRERAGRPRGLRGDALKLAELAYEKYKENDMDVRDIMEKFGYVSSSTFYRHIKYIENRNN